MKTLSYKNYYNLIPVAAIKTGICQEIHTEASHLQNSCIRQKE
jgi:hypothetical protein